MNSLEMDNVDITISTTDELSYLLGKVYWIQSKYKQSIYWLAYVSSVTDEFRDLIFKLSHKAENHKLLLRDFCSNLKDIDPIKTMEKMNFEIPRFDLKDKKQEEIITKLADIERIAHDIYSKIYEHTDKDLIKEIWSDKDIEKYYDKLKKLIVEENEFIDLLKPFISNIERVL